MGNRFFHRRTIAGQEELGLNPERLLRKGRAEVLRERLEEETRTAETRLGRLLEDVLVRRHERETVHLLGPVDVDVKDTEEVALRDVLAVHHIAEVRIIVRRESRPHERALARPANEATIPHDHQHTPLAIRLVRDRVAGEDRVRAARHQVAAGNRDRIQERNPARIRLQLVALHVRLREEERALLVGSNHGLGVLKERPHNRSRLGLFVQDLQLQLIGRRLLEDVSEGLGGLGLGLDQRHVNPQKPIRTPPRAAVENPDVVLGVHRTATEVTTQRLLLAEGHAKLEIRNVHDILLSSDLGIPRLALHLQGNAAEAPRRAHLENLLGRRDVHPKSIRIREGRPMCFGIAT